MAALTKDENVAAIVIFSFLQRVGIIFAIASRVGDF
jgi:hypothetical protein